MTTRFGRFGRGNTDNNNQGTGFNFRQAAVNVNTGDNKSKILSLTHDNTIKDLVDPINGGKLMANDLDVRSIIEEIDKHLQIQDNLMQQLTTQSEPSFPNVQLQRETVLNECANLAATQKEVHDINLKPLEAEFKRIQNEGEVITFSRARIISSAIDDTSGGGATSGRRGGNSSVHSDVPFPSPVLTQWLKSARTRKDELCTLLDQTEAAVSQMGSLLHSGGAVDPQVEEEMLKQIMNYLGQSIIRIASESIDPMATEVSKLRDAVNELAVYIPTESTDLSKVSSLSSSANRFRQQPPRDIFEMEERKLRIEQDNDDKGKQQKLKELLEPPNPFLQISNTSSSSTATTTTTTNKFGSGTGKVWGQATTTTTVPVSGNVGGTAALAIRTNTAAPLANNQQQPQQQQQQQQQQQDQQGQGQPKPFGQRTGTTGFGFKKFGQQ